MNLNLTSEEALTLYTLTENHRTQMEHFVAADLVGQSLKTEDHLTTLADKLADACVAGMKALRNGESDGYSPLQPKPAAFRGGSFTDSLHRAFCMADGDNRLRLEAAFPGLGAYSAKRLAS